MHRVEGRRGTWIAANAVVGVGSWHHVGCGGVGRVWGSRDAVVVVGVVCVGVISSTSSTVGVVSATVVVVSALLVVLLLWRVCGGVISAVICDVAAVASVVVSALLGRVSLSVVHCLQMRMSWRKYGGIDKRERCEGEKDEIKDG